MAKVDYIVGYGKPPEKTRFKKGQSGNRKGRPKKAPSLLASYEKIRKELVSVTSGGKTRKIPAINALMQRVMHDALSGNLRAFETVWRLEQRLTETEATDARPTGKDEFKRSLFSKFFQSYNSGQCEVTSEPARERPINEIE